MDKPLAMIVEDDAMLGEIYVKTLEAGFEVELIANGLDALARIQGGERIPELVLLDINLPGVSGMKIFESLRANPAFNRSRVIICSANPQAVEMLDERADLALVKPVSPIQLRSLAERILAG